MMMFRAVCLGFVAALLVAAPARALVILQYHHISDSTPPSTSTSPALFRQHLNLIAESGFDVVSLETVTERLRNDQPLPDKAVLITFDDSYASIHDTAFPLLKARGWPFVVFANTGPVGSGGDFLSWEDYREMAAHGAAIANHSVRHTHFARRPGDVSERQWRQRMREELLDAERAIEREVGQSHRVLAFPYGEYDATVLAVMQELGFLGMSQASGAVRSEDALAMPRFPMGGRFGRVDNFMLKLRALPLPLASTTLATESGEVLVDGVLPRGGERPLLRLVLPSNALAQALQCYASGQLEPISREIAGNTVTVQADRPLPAGRSRYNCTARDPDSGRYHWYSRPFLRPNDKGHYPPEA